MDHDLSVEALQAMPDDPEQEEEEDDDSDDEVDEEEFARQHARATVRGARGSVSAEAYGSWNRKSGFIAPVYPKEPEREVYLAEVVSQNFMFSALQREALQLVIGAMQPHEAQGNDCVIREGDDGDFLFVVEAGSLECSKIIDGVPTVVREPYGPGEFFGELALLYNCPRAATVVALEPTLLWKLDRESFNHIVKDAAAARLERCKQFVVNCQLFSHLDLYSTNKLCEAFKSLTFQAGEAIIQQGDVGDVMYFIESGQCQAIKALQDGSQEEFIHGPGDYFGELALLRNEPRAATVVAAEEVSLMAMDCSTFKALLGPLRDTLLQQAGRYGGAE